MASNEKYYKARKIITDILKKDFIGPVYENEILAEIPTQYYIMGKLYPQNAVEDDLDSAMNPFLENKAEFYDASISLSNQRNPSSLGITCTLKANVRDFIISGSYAFYTPIEFEQAESQGIDISQWLDFENKPDNLWMRNEYDFRENIFLEDEKASHVISLRRGLTIQVFTHAVLSGGERIITIALVNTNTVEEKATSEDRARLCAFQTSVKISGFNDIEIFADTNRQTQLSTDKELQELNLLYSDIHCYAQGHGCSAIWDLENSSPLWGSTSWMPTYNLHQMMAQEIEDKQVLSMKYLANTNDIMLINSLRKFNMGYLAWIEDTKKSASKFNGYMKETAERNVKKCRQAYLRIERAIDLLENSSKSDGKAIFAFKLANEAMLQQRIQTLSKSQSKIIEDEINWYPFQLAFILHELYSFIEPNSNERNIVDFLWFPTGGGKTEAYLGIAAFVIFLRRLRNAEDDGVSVIMRYTLRLLTIQQFERASILICACELLRKKYEHIIGKSEISIGLWVGGKLTPNTLSEAGKSIEKQKNGAVLVPDESNPCQIKVCPWCGNKISSEDYYVDSVNKRMIIKCSNPKCAFHNCMNGLPIHIIDEAVYEHLPTFIVATVDKYAQIPLSNKPAALFGISQHKNPPELIIQDELHLISGPLGTMIGIYEAAITKLCEKNGIGAKIIASTATIRNAKNQILALYGKDYTQFPPQGISSKDSYFAVESTEQERPSRKYCGVMGIGVTATTALIRVNAALLYATRYLAACGFEDEIVDNFWTITGYFNSLRELGGARTQILDDVQSRFSYLAKTKFGSEKSSVDYNVAYDYSEELTSRMSNSEITNIIQDRLKRSYGNGIHNDVYDFVLASNMISVGVDVGRLGIMTVAGQPKTNAEYIQATSRVGRSNPGLVITVYNPTRSRDRSHYEQFMRYHSALYRYVEATSLTPFADRARDRGLHALYVSLCRYLIPGLLSNESASKYRQINSNVEKIKNIILDYVKIVDPDETNFVKQELNDIDIQWDEKAVNSFDSLVYKSNKNGNGLLKKDTEDDRFRTMNSMRSVDVQSGIYLLGGK